MTKGGDELKPFRRKLLVLVALLGPLLVREGPSLGWIFAFCLVLTLVGLIFLIALALLLRKEVLPSIRASSWELMWGDVRVPSTDQEGKGRVERAVRVEHVESVALPLFG